MKNVQLRWVLGYGLQLESPLITVQATNTAYGFVYFTGEDKAYGIVLLYFQL